MTSWCQILEYSGVLGIIGAGLFLCFFPLTMFFLFLGQHDGDRFALLKWGGFRTRYLTPTVRKTRRKAFLCFFIAWLGCLLMSHQLMIKDLGFFASC